MKIITWALALVVALVVASCGEDEADDAAKGGSANIQTLSGSTNDVVPDERLGSEPLAADDAPLEVAAEAAGCELRVDLPDEGNNHIPPGAPAPRYETTPPASGDHVVPPLQQADGAYAEPVEDVNAVHALEHGRVAIQYRPDLPADTQLELKGVFDEDPAGMLLFPNLDLKGAVAVSAWTRLLECPGYEGAATVGAIRSFRDEFRGNGPEPVPIELSG